jgi:hypothetical protein
VDVFPGDKASLVQGRGFTPGEHEGIDLVPEKKRGLGNDAADTPVVALLKGTYITGAPHTQQNQVLIKSQDGSYVVGYNHIKVDLSKNWRSVSPGETIGKLVRWQDDIEHMVLDENGKGMAHLDLRLSVNSNKEDPSGLIVRWGDPALFGN